LKKERELEDLEKSQGKELTAIDQDFATQEANLRLAFGVKRARIESRWKTQALIERAKMEEATGLWHAPLPEVIAVDDSHTLDFTI